MSKKTRNPILDRACQLANGQAALARLIGVEPPTIHGWRHGDRPIPSGRVIQIARALNWQITPHEIDPDLYPNPWDGLPIGIASAQSQESDRAPA